MAKPKRYPRKLRQKLEKIADARDARAAEEGSEKLDPFNTFHRSFLPSNSVHTMHVVFDDVRQRLVTHVFMLPTPRAPRISRSPPWLSETDAEPVGSSE